MSEKKPAAEVADEIAEGVRALNYATMPGAGLTYPGDAYSTVGNLSTAANRLPQALGQIGRFLLDLAEAERLTADDGGDPVRRIMAARTALEDAAECAANLHAALSRAQSSINTVAYKEA